MCIYPKPSMPILETHFARREAVPRALRHHPSLDQSTIKISTAWCLWPSGPLQLSPISRHSVWPPAAPWVLYTHPPVQRAVQWARISSVTSSTHHLFEQLLQACSHGFPTSEGNKQACFSDCPKLCFSSSPEWPAQVLACPQNWWNK